MRRIATSALFLVLVATASHAARRKGGGLDEGLLQPTWFGGELEMREIEEPEIDYLWVKDGFDLSGRTLKIVDWQEAELLGEDRDAKDAATAADLTGRMPGWLKAAIGASLGDGAPVSRDEGDLELHGQIVDCNAGSKAAKWLVGLGAGSATATWNMKIVDAASGELLVALHHRAISGTTMSDIDDKVIKWLDEDLGVALQKGLAGLYAGGKKVKK